MAFELKDGQGTLHRVEEKKNEQGPDYEGKLLVDGKQYRVAGWIKTTSAGKKWLSLKAEVPRAKLEEPRKPQPDNDGDSSLFRRATWPQSSHVSRSAKSSAVAATRRSGTGACWPETGSAVHGERHPSVGNARRAMIRVMDLLASRKVEFPTQ